MTAPKKKTFSFENERPIQYSFVGFVENNLKELEREKTELW